MRPNSLAIIAFTGTLTMFGPFSTDMQVPMLPALTEYFGTSAQRAQLSMSLFMIGFGLGQFVMGPISDRFGRKPVLLGGMAVFVAASVICALAPSIEVLIAARFLQAFGTASAYVLSRAVIRDMHDAAGTTRVMSFAMLLMGSTSLYAPALGGLLVEWPGWQAVFAIHVVLGAVMVLTTWRFYDESVPAKIADAMRPMTVLRNCLFLGRDPVFYGYSLSLGLVVAAMGVFVSSGPFVFRAFGLAPSEFGLLFTAIAATFMIGSLLCSRLARRIAAVRLFGFALFVAVAAILVTTAMAWSPLASVATVMAPLMGVSFAMGFIMPLGFAGALGAHPRLAGTASSLAGFQQAMLSSVSGILGIAVFDGTAGPMALLMSAFVCCALLVYFFFLHPQRRRLSQ